MADLLGTLPLTQRQEKLLGDTCTDIETGEVPWTLALTETGEVPWEHLH